MKKSGLLALVLCALLMLGSIGIAEEPTYDLNLWCFADTHARYYEYIAEQYHNEHPNVTITIECMDNTSLRDRLKIATAAGGEGAPDIVDVEQGTWPSFMSDNDCCFEPIDALLERDGLFDGLVKARLDLYAYAGNYFGIEHALCPVLMAYRPDLFEAAGIEVPTTWEEYKTAAYALKENGVYIVTTGDMHNGIPGIIEQLSRAAHCDIVTEDGKFQMTDDYLTMLDDVRQLIADECIFVAETDADKYFEIGENHVATDLVADWAAGWLRDNVPEQSGMWRMTYLPKFNEESSRVSINGGTGVCMTKFNDEATKEVCWDFIKYSLIDAENCITKYEMVSLYPPVYAAMDACNTPVEYYGDQNLGEMWQELAPETPVQYQAAFRAVYAEIVANYLYDFVEGDMDIAAFGEAVKADMAEYM